MKTTIFFLALAASSRVWFIENQPTEAEFVTFSNNKVILKVADGFLVIKPEDLSSADIKYYQGILRQNYNEVVDQRKQYSQVYRMNRFQQKQQNRQQDYRQAQKNLSWAIRAQQVEFSRFYFPQAPHCRPRRRFQ